MEANQSEFLGKFVLSSNFGVGTVMGIDDMGIEGKEFLVIECIGKNVKNFIPVGDTNNYRFAVTAEKFDLVTEELKQTIDVPDFDSKKDRINHYKNEAGIQDLDNIVKVIKELRELDSRSSVEEQIYARLIESVALEHSVVFKSPIEESTSLINSIINQQAA